MLSLIFFPIKPLLSPTQHGGQGASVEAQVDTYNSKKLVSIKILELNNNPNVCNLQERRKKILINHPKFQALAPHNEIFNDGSEFVAD